MKEQDFVQLLAESIAKIINTIANDKIYISKTVPWENSKIVTDYCRGTPVSYLIVPNGEDYKRTPDIRTLTHILCPNFHFVNKEGVKDFAGMGEEHPVIVILGWKIYINLTPFVDALLDEYGCDTGRSTEDLIHTVESALITAIKEDSDLNKYDIVFDGLNPVPDYIKVGFMTMEIDDDIKWSIYWEEEDENENEWWDDYYWY